MDSVHSLVLMLNITLSPLVFPLLKCLLSQERGQALQMKTDQASQPPKAANPSVSVRPLSVFCSFFSFLVPGEHNCSVLMEEKDGFFPQVNLFPRQQKQACRMGSYTTLMV